MKTKQMKQATAINYLDICAVGGVSFEVRLIAEFDSSSSPAQQPGEYLGRTEFGTVDAEGQYHGDDDEVIEHVRAEYGISDEIPARVR